MVPTAALEPGHAFVPRLPGNAMSLLETFLPWLGLVGVCGLVLAVVRRSLATALAGALVLVA
ncbi:hypothetical protein [Streptomyces sp. NBC_01216]|uniref:hypothetical protein n=1 Tax=unclassified Streptomyces TaxID=2593676 RepID=UPI002E149F0F|nr:hypothetical protein OG393_31435 [Streptomyces sp. NBC_01216]